MPNNEEQSYLESLVRAEFERCHPDDTFEDLKRRAAFSKKTRGCCGTGWPLPRLAPQRSAPSRHRWTPRHRGRRPRGNSAPPRDMGRASRVR
jgi:hypothetical protein